ncbi:hypothetical protein BESB_007620 [Besnoitia besnoiti]|uniref:Transmembrane protein n=1 Tax=Besnoitia besnoiti TaxID=94643 RepID=A0A2A9MQP1_BESBE|nr:hypothetical protein BESB_007620 [Besnoitia besnoiti]PFH38420.1 hypothetical protein BESB_007620 [Besnoitia besnoiti]
MRGWSLDDAAPASGVRPSRERGESLKVLSGASQEARTHKRYSGIFGLLSLAVAVFAVAWVSFTRIREVEKAPKELEEGKIGEGTPELLDEEPVEPVKPSKWLPRVMCAVLTVAVVSAITGALPPYSPPRRYPQPAAGLQPAPFAREVRDRRRATPRPPNYHPVPLSAAAPSQSPRSRPNRFPPPPPFGPSSALLRPSTPVPRPQPAPQEEEAGASVELKPAGEVTTTTEEGAAQGGRAGVVAKFIVDVIYSYLWLREDFAAGEHMFEAHTGGGGRTQRSPWEAEESVDQQGGGGDLGSSSRRWQRLRAIRRLAEPPRSRLYGCMGEAAPEVARDGRLRARESRVSFWSRLLLVAKRVCVSGRGARGDSAPGRQPDAFLRGHVQTRAYYRGFMTAGLPQRINGTLLYPSWSGGCSFPWKYNFNCFP